MAWPKGKPQTAEHRAKNSAAQKGRTVSEATLAMFRGPRSPEHRAKIGAGLRGRPKSPEHREKLAALYRGKPQTPAQRAGIRAWLDNPPVLGECVYCFGPATTHDHVVPLSRGGVDTADNVVLACWSCNSSKNDRTPEEWFRDMTA